MNEEPLQPLFTFNNRGAFPSLLNNWKLLGIGAEIGVQKGIFSEWLLKHWQGEKLFSIDPWREFSSDAYQDIANVAQKQHEANYTETVQRLQPFGSRSSIIRATSEEACASFEDNRLDFAYIDAQHQYEAVAKDICLWWRKVKVGGILCGHDYMEDGVHDKTLFGVKKAVDELIRSHKLQFFLTDEKELSDGPDVFNSWFVIKK